MSKRLLKMSVATYRIPIVLDPATGYYKCFNCGKLFPRKSNYERHMKRKTPCGIVEGESSKPFSCTYCGRGYIKKQM